MFSYALLKGTLRFTVLPSSVSAQVDCMRPFSLICAAKGPDIQSINWSGDIANSHSEYESRLDDCGEREIGSTLTVNGHFEIHSARFTCHGSSTSSYVISYDTFVPVLCMCFPELS